MEKTRRYTVLFGAASTFDRPADATAYAAGDEVANSATAGSVVRGTVDLGSGVRKARIVRAGVHVTPASGNVVITAFDLALLVMKTSDSPPAAVGDNVALAITAAQRAKAAKFAFANNAWTAPNGGVAAGASAFQEVLPAVSVAGSGAIAGNMFDFTQGDALPLVSTSTARQLTCLLQIQAAWTPLAVVNTIGIVLDIEVEE